MRVAQGVDPLNANPDHSAAKYFHDEAYFQLVNSKQIRGHHVESDAIAALHLVSYSLFSGGVTDWQPVLVMACDWLTDTGLAVSENPKLALSNMSATAKLAVKITLVGVSSLTYVPCSLKKDVLLFSGTTYTRA